MKNLKSLTIALAITAMALTGCDRVAPNEIGVLVQNYGKNPEKDYSITSGKVVTAFPGTTLYKIPGYEQRNEIDSAITNKSSDGTEFSVKTRYSYRVNPASATKVVKEYTQIFKEGGDLKQVEVKALDPTITDIVRDIIMNSSSSKLMAEGGNAGFTDEARKRIEKAFADRGFILMSFSTILDYSASVKASIDARNQANSQVATLDSQIIKAKKENELAQITAQTTVVNGQAITEQQLRMAWIEKWSGDVPQTVIVSNKDQVSMFLPPAETKK